MTDRETARRGDGGGLNPAVRDGLGRHTVELETTDPVAPLDDLAALDDLVAGSRIVGLGEATHGTREFFRLKHRLLRYLVVEHGLRAVALEANFPETLAIDEYVVHGRGDPEAALDGVYFWTWNVDSVLALIEWLREFNDGRPVEDRVRFYGIDAQYTAGAVERLREYFAAVDATLPASITEGLERVDDGGSPANDGTAEDRLAAGERLVSALREHLDDNRDAYVAREGEAGWRLARQHATVLEQATVYQRARAASQREDGDEETIRRLLRVRDRAMADNVDWLLGDAERIAVWAHDAHVNRSKHVHRGEGVAETPMGGYLADRHGEAYVALGFAFGSGSFQALSEVRGAGSEDATYELRGQTLRSPLPATIDAALDALGYRLALLNVRTAREDEDAGPWLSEPRRHFSAGATYDSEAPEESVTEYTYADAFDAVCFVSETTRARPVDEEVPD